MLKCHEKLLMFLDDPYIKICSHQFPCVPTLVPAYFPDIFSSLELNYKNILKTSYVTFSERKHTADVLVKIDEVTVHSPL